ncbi:MAG TPA: hypothetical protein VH591_17075 [Ktedonobacterales bacterium]|jgi:hypothetical protein
MLTPRVDLTQVNLLSQLVLRAGNIRDPRAQQVAREQYQRANTNYTDLKVGLSCLFRPGASFDDLAREGFFPNTRLSAATIQHLVSELAAIGCEPALYTTPVIPRYPNHHTLVFFRGGMLELTLQDDVLQALVRAMTIVANPHQQQKPGR